MRRQGEHRQAVEDHPVDHGVPEVLGGQQHDERDHKVRVHDQQPGQHGADHAAAVADEPHPVGRVSLSGRGGRGVIAVILAQQRVVLDVPQPVP